LTNRIAYEEKKELLTKVGRKDAVWERSKRKRMPLSGEGGGIVRGDHNMKERTKETNGVTDSKKEKGLRKKGGI